METWRIVWRNGFAPVMDRTHLKAVASGLRADDSRLTQGSTCTPSPLMQVQDWPCEGACCFGYGLLATTPGVTVSEVEQLFVETCFQADKRLGEPAGCRYFLNWFDDTPRDEMRRELLAEVERAILLPVVAKGDAARNLLAQVRAGRTDLRPILADALEEDGEEDAELLAELRRC